jgi:hypothetical protein
MEDGAGYGGFSVYVLFAGAQEYADIYATQDELAEAERQAARDAILSLAPFVNTDKKDPDPTPAQAAAMKEKIEVLQGQSMLVDSLMQSLGVEYKKFLAAHPEH